MNICNVLHIINVYIIMYLLSLLREHNTDVLDNYFIMGNSILLFRQIRQKHVQL